MLCLLFRLLCEVSLFYLGRYVNFHVATLATFVFRVAVNEKKTWKKDE